MRKRRLGWAGLCAVSAVLLAPTSASAVDPGVGVNGCDATAPNGNPPGQCYSITVPGYYYLSVDGHGGGALGEVNCSQGGSLSTTGYAWGYLNGGLCTVFVYGDY